MKTVNRKFWLFSLPLAMCLFLINSCTRDDAMVGEIPPPTYEYGTDVVKMSDGYSFDKSHSSVRWETFYLGSAALLTGRFNSFDFTLEFDENNPENTSITGLVTLSTVNTGEPGRDGGCLLNTFGIAEYGDEATFTSTSVEKDGKGGYKITGDLNFHGVTSPVVGSLEYFGTTFFDENSGTHGAPLNVAGFIIRFEMNAKSVFGIESGNISDVVTVIASGQFKQSL